MLRTRTVIVAIAAMASLRAIASATCIGDCGNDGTVSVNELIVGVNIALARADVGECSALDANGDGDVRVGMSKSGRPSSSIPCTPSVDAAQVGGFGVVEPGVIWQITHTDFGPGASSHLTLMGGTVADTYNTFAGEHVEDLALDRDEDLLFFPDPCIPGPASQSCDTGIHVFHAHSGEPAAAEGVDVGFPPIEVVVSR